MHYTFASALRVLEEHHWRLMRFLTPYRIFERSSDELPLLIEVEVVDVSLGDVVESIGRVHRDYVDKICELTGAETSDFEEWPYPEESDDLS